jgi:hypothetical protein
MSTNERNHPIRYYIFENKIFIPVEDNALYQVTAIENFPDFVLRRAIYSGL